MESKSLTTAIPTELQEISSRIEQWRSNRVQRGPMPEALWSLAADLARQHGVGRVSRFLRLDYYSLKARVEAGNQGSIPVSEARPTFIEVPLIAGAECTIELEHPRGPRMRIHLKGASMLDVTSLSRTLWSMKG
jgi:hypothetical protein